MFSNLDNSNKPGNLSDVVCFLQLERPFPGMATVHILEQEAETEAIHEEQLPEVDLVRPEMDGDDSRRLWTPTSPCRYIGKVLAFIIFEKVSTTNFISAKF